MVDIHRTLGALMIGGIVAAMLVILGLGFSDLALTCSLLSFSGIVTAQAFAYFKQYPEDRRAIKILVCSTSPFIHQI